MAHFDVRRVISAVPKPGAASQTKLRSLPADALVAVLCDPKRPWWRRVPCAQALVGRATDAHARAIWTRVIDAEEVTEVARACLTVLEEAWKTTPPDEALTWLRAQEGRALKYGMHESLLNARGRMGDLSAAGPLCELVFCPWAHRHQAARDAMRALGEARGTGAVTRHLGARTGSWAGLSKEGPTAAARFTGLALDPAPSVAGCLGALADPHVAVAHAAHERLVATTVSTADLLGFADARLEALARCRDAPPSLTGDAAAACWALVAAARKAPCEATRLQIDTRWRQVGQPRLEHPGVPEDIRRAILREHLPAQRETDPRLLVEGLLSTAPTDARPSREPACPEQARSAHAALDAAGFAPAAPVSAGAANQQGAGTYHVVATADLSVKVSDLGPWVMAESRLPAAVHRALTEAGLEILDDELLTRTFEGLPVYFFGDREPLSIEDLLFYWQD